MGSRVKPPFRADQVGSLIRPPALREARQAYLGGTLSGAELQAIEDRGIRDVIAMQERVGLEPITDGEFRRTSFREVLFDNVDGFSKERVAGLGSGGYEPIAERVFGRLAVDGYLLEFDTPRAGDFAPLRFLPPGKIAVLGLMSTKVPDLETKDELKRRVDEGAKVVGIDRLGLCPQCGFATAYHYDRLTIDDQERKLARLVEVANEIWG